jgi:hypothetical protein
MLVESSVNVPEDSITTFCINKNKSKRDREGEGREGGTKQRRKDEREGGREKEKERGRLIDYMKEEVQSLI